MLYLVVETICQLGAKLCVAHGCEKRNSKAAVKWARQQAPSCTRHSNFRLLNFRLGTPCQQHSINFNLGRKSQMLLLLLMLLLCLFVLLMGRCCCVCHRCDNSNLQHGCQAFWTAATAAGTLSIKRCRICFRHH